jgi:hypothetical protein
VAQFCKLVWNLSFSTLDIQYTISQLFPNNIFTILTCSISLSCSWHNSGIALLHFNSFFPPPVMFHCDVEKCIWRLCTLQKSTEIVVLSKVQWEKTFFIQYLPHTLVSCSHCWPFPTLNASTNFSVVEYSLVSEIIENLFYHCFYIRIHNIQAFW